MKIFIPYLLLFAWSSSAFGQVLYFKPSFRNEMIVHTLKGAPAPNNIVKAFLDPINTGSAFALNYQIKKGLSVEIEGSFTTMWNAVRGHYEFQSTGAERTSSRYSGFLVDRFSISIYKKLKTLRLHIGDSWLRKAFQAPIKVFNPYARFKSEHLLQFDLEVFGGFSGHSVRDHTDDSLSQLVLNPNTHGQERFTIRYGAERIDRSGDGVHIGLNLQFYNKRDYKSWQLSVMYHRGLRKYYEHDWQVLVDDEVYTFTTATRGSFLSVAIGIPLRLADFSPNRRARRRKSISETR